MAHAHTGRVNDKDLGPCKVMIYSFAFALALTFFVFVFFNCCNQFSLVSVLAFYSGFSHFSLGIIILKCLDKVLFLIVSVGVIATLASQSLISTLQCLSVDTVPVQLFFPKT